jgi:hypothetical protein
MAMLAMLASPAMAAMRATPEFESGETRPKTIAVLPVQASVVKAKVVETESLVEESTLFGGMFANGLRGILEGAGYRVRFVTPDEVNADPQLQEYVVDANRRYEELSSQVRPNRIKRRIYNAGDEARLLADYLDVDAVAFSRLQVVAAAPGRTAVALLVGIGSLGTSSASLMLVDGDTADVEALFFGTAVGSSAKSIEEDPQGEMARMAASTLTRLPPAGEAAADESADDEDVLSEVESLLEE